MVSAVFRVIRDIAISPLPKVNAADQCIDECARCSFEVQLDTPIGRSRRSDRIPGNGSVDNVTVGINKRQTRSIGLTLFMSVSDAVVRDGSVVNLDIAPQKARPSPANSQIGGGAAGYRNVILNDRRPVDMG